MIPYGKQSIDEDDIAAVVDVLRSDFLTQGPKVAEFEEAFAAEVGAKYAVAVNSGTAALHACMVALGIGPGDEVIVPPITFTATANCVLFVGATPVFADVTTSGHIDPEQIEQKITKKTKAVIAVDYAGWPCNYGRILEICEKHGLALVCDACHALGATWNGRPVGSIGRLNTFSFHPVKHIATGEGGMVTTEDAELAERMREFRTHGITKDAAKFKGLVSVFSVQGAGVHQDRTEHRTPNTEPSCFPNPQSPIPDSINPSTHQPLSETGPWYYEMQSLGYNYRMPDINAALGLSQLKKLDRFVARRREIAKLYYEGLGDIPHFSLPASDLQADSRHPQSPIPNTPYPLPHNQHHPATHSFHLFPVQIDFPALGKTRVEVMEELHGLGIGTQVHYIPVCRQPYYRAWLAGKDDRYSGAEAFYTRELSLPMYPGMGEHEAARVVGAIRSVCRVRE